MDAPEDEPQPSAAKVLNLPQLQHQDSTDSTAESQNLLGDAASSTQQNEPPATATQKPAIHEKNYDGSSIAAGWPHPAVDAQPERFSHWQTVRAHINNRALARQSAAGTQSHMTGRSLGVFGIRNRARFAVYRLMFSQGYEYFLCFTTIAHVIITAFLSGNRAVGTQVFIRHVNYDVLQGLDYALCILFTVETLLRIFALGLWRGKHTYLRNGYNVMDALIVISIWATKISRWGGSHQPFRPAVFRGFRAVLCLRNVPTVTGIIVTLDAIGISMKALVHIMNLFLITFVIFILAGVSLYQTSYSRRCVLYQGPGPDDFSYGNPSWFCGSTNPHKSKGFECPAESGQVCKAGIQDPQYGFQGFDNFAQNMLLVFQVLTNEEWYEIMWNLMDSEFRYACAYFMAIIVIGTYFFWNVWLNALLAIFIRLNKQAAATKLIHKMRRARAGGKGSASSKALGQGDDFAIVVDAARQQDKLRRDKEAAIVPVSTDAKAPLPAVQSAPEQSGWRANALAIWDPESRKRWAAVARAAVAPLIESWWFEGLTFVFVVVNMGILASYRYDHTKLTSRRADNATKGFSALFLLEVLCRMAYEGPRSYLSSPVEVIDFVVVVLSVANAASGKLLDLNMIRMVRYTRVLTRTETGRKSVPYRMMASVPSVVTFMLYFFIVVSIFAVLGMQLFGGRFNFEEGEPRANFDSFWNGFLSMYQVSSQQNWPYVMFDSMRVAGKSAPIVAVFYAGYYLATNFVLLSLIVAAVLEQYSVRDSERRALQRRQAIRHAANTQIDRNAFVRLAERVRIRLLLYFRWVIYSEEEALMASKYLRFLALLEEREQQLLMPAAQQLSLAGEAKGSTPSVLQKRRVTEQLFGANRLTSRSFTGALPAAPTDNLLLPHVAARSSAVAPEPAKDPLSPDEQVMAAPPQRVADALGTDAASPATAAPASLAAAAPATDIEAGPPEPITLADAVASLQRTTSTASDSAASDTSDTPLMAGVTSGGSSPRRRSAAPRPSLLARTSSVAPEPTEGQAAAPTSETQVLVLRAPPPSQALLTERLAAHLYGDSMRYRPEDAVILKAMLDMERLDAHTGRVVPTWMNERSMFLFGPQNRIRLFIQRVTAHRIYQFVSLVMVAVSVLGNLWTPPVGKVFQKRHTVRLINYATALYFAMDMLLRCIADGVLFTPGAYLLNVHHLLDVALLLIDGLVLLSFKPYLERAIRMAFSARAMRFITISKVMRKLAGALIQTVVPILTVLGFCVTVFIMFAIVALRLMSGKFYSCNDGNVSVRAECIGSFLDVDNGGLWMPRVWDKPNYNFDGFGKAMLSLFELTTMDNWPDFMHQGMDSVGINEQPVTNHSSSYSVFFVMFMTVSAFFLTRAFVGVFIKQYMLITGNEVLTDKQRAWRDMVRISRSLRPLPLQTRPQHKLQGRCYDVIHWRHFPALVVAVVLANTAFQMTSWAFEPRGWHTALEVINLLFVLAYTAELFAKIAQERTLKAWAKNPWNLAEAVIVLGSLATVMTVKGETREVVGRPFKFARILRIVRYVAGLQTLASTIMAALPATLQVSGLMGVIMCMYAGVGTQLFAYVKRGQPGGITRQVNFESFGNTFLILFQIMTSEGWRQPMDDCKLTQPHCTPHPADGQPSDCGFQVGATIYFCSYLVIVSNIIMALFMAVSAEYVHYDLVVNDTAIITVPHLQQFQRKWSELDPSGSGFIRLWQLRQLVTELGPPLGFWRPSARWWRLIRWEAWSLRVASPQGGLPFRETLHMLLRARLGLSALTYEERAKRELQVVDFARTGATTYIQACLRGRNARKRVRALRQERRLNPPPPRPPKASQLGGGEVQPAEQQAPLAQQPSSRMLPFSPFGRKVAEQGYLAF